MSILDFLRGNRGRHATCPGCHWHATTPGWRCCSCKKTVSSRKDRPANTGECRLDNNTGPAGPVAGEQQRNQVTDDDTLRWLRTLTEPLDDAVALPAAGRRRLNGRSPVNRARTGRSDRK